MGLEEILKQVEETGKEKAAAIRKETVEEVGQKIFELVVNTASGNKSKSEINGYGDEEFNPWQVGVVM